MIVLMRLTVYNDIICYFYTLLHLCNRCQSTFKDDRPFRSAFRMCNGVIILTNCLLFCQILSTSGSAFRMCNSVIKSNIGKQSNGVVVSKT